MDSLLGPVDMLICLGGCRRHLRVVLLGYTALLAVQATPEGTDFVASTGQPKAARAVSWVLVSGVHGNGECQVGMVGYQQLLAYIMNVKLKVRSNWLL
jgi:hypothetical protein